MQTYYDILFKLITTKNHISQPIEFGSVKYPIDKIYESCFKRHECKFHDLYFKDLIIKWNELKIELDKLPISKDTDYKFSLVYNIYLREIKEAISSYDIDTLIVCLIMVKFKTYPFQPPNNQMSPDPVLKEQWVKKSILDENRWDIIIGIQREMYARNNKWPIFTFISGNPIKKEFVLGGRQRSRSKRKRLASRVKSRPKKKHA
jgi:hypothetical protein